MQSSILKGLFLSGALAVTGSIFAQEQILLPEGFNSGSMNELLGTNSSEFGAPKVMQEGNLLYVESLSPESLSHLYIKVSSQKGRVVYSERIEAAATALDLEALGLPDGKYEYQVSATYAPQHRAGLPLGLERVNKRSAGRFTIRDGMTSTPMQMLRKDIQGRQDAAIINDLSLPMRLAGWLLDLAVADAHADISATDLQIENSSPSVLFDDTNDGAGNTNEEPWEFSIDWSASNSGVDGDATGFFRIREWAEGSVGSHDVFRIDWDEATTADLLDESIHIQNDGNIDMVDGNFSVLRNGSFSATGAGSINGTDSSSLLIMGSEDTSDTYDDIFTILYSWYGSDTVDPGFGLNFNLFGPTPFFVEYPAPTDSLRINDTGTVSLAAGGKIHVGSDADPVGQFTITSAVQPRFEMNDTTTGKRWRFSVASDKFAINNLDVAGTEFQVFDNGNMLITGALTQNSDVNAKQDIVPVDSKGVLDRIANLPISEWSYIDAPNERHIGPMAQDFHAAFGLGMGKKSIATLDTSGVALAGIKALKAENDRLSAENSALEARVEALENRQTQIIATLSILTDADKPLLTSLVQEN